jgi:hypothetical protein
MQMDGHPPKRCSPAAPRSANSRGAALVLALVTAACGAIAACGATSEPLPLSPGRSTLPPGGPTAAPSASARAPERWDRWGELAGWRVAIERTPSQHLAADHEAETLANDAAAAYPSLGPARHLGPGAVLAQRLYAPGSAIPEVVFAMVRRAEPASPGAEGAGAEGVGAEGAGWEYLVVDPGGFVAERGDLAACARCHAEAPHDGLFGRAQ